MTKFSDRIKKSATTSPIILANDYDSKTPNIESKTLKNIKLLSDYLCGIKINFHLLLQLDKKQISKINKAAHDSGLQCIADIKLNDIGNTIYCVASRWYIWSYSFHHPIQIRFFMDPGFCIRCESFLDVFDRDVV